MPGSLLTRKEAVTPEDLLGIPLVCPHQELSGILMQHQIHWDVVRVRLQMVIQLE